MIAPPLHHNHDGVASLYGLSGYQIIEESHCTKGEEYIVSRSWRERLFSWPWRPWATTKVVTVRVPDEKVYVLNDSVIVCHPTIAAELRARLFGEGP